MRSAEYRERPVAVLKGNIKKVSEKVSDFARQRDKTPPSDHKKVLDMTLPTKHMEILCSILSTIGFETFSEEISSDPTDITYSYNKTSNNGIKRFLLRIPDPILENPNRENKRTLISIRTVFKEVLHAKTLHVFHDKDIVHPSTINMMQFSWPQEHGINTKYIQLNSLPHLEAMEEDERRLRCQVKEVTKSSREAGSISTTSTTPSVLHSNATLAGVASG